MDLINLLIPLLTLIVLETILGIEIGLQTQAFLIDVILTEKKPKNGLRLRPST